MELSKRLQAVADLVSPGLTFADVGTDHGYIPIYLVQTKKSPKALAMDINKGPLLRAKEHISEYNLAEEIETRLSDGVQALIVGECDCVVIAGMGGALTIKIIEEGKALFRGLKEFVLQPQSELAKVRRYLYEEGFCVTTENMVLEDGKFYPMMKVVNGQDLPYQQEELCYGRKLLEEKHPVLKVFLEKEMSSKKIILEKLELESGEHIAKRKTELKEEIHLAKQALQVYL